MSNKIKINTIIISPYSNNIKNNNNTVFPLQYKRQPDPKKTPILDNSFNKNLTILNNTNENNNTNESPKYFEDNNNLNNTNKIKELSKQNKKIFNIRKEKRSKWKRKKHDANSKDNIKQIIIRHFINFFVTFINLFVRKITKNELITFKIGYQDKRGIKSGDILELTVEKMLLFSPSKNKNNVKSDNKEKTPKYNYNRNQLIEIRNIIGSSLDILFNTHVINIFKDIYISKEKKIDLKNYGFEGIVLKLNKNIKAYEKLKRKYRGNKIKLKIMDNIIDTKFIHVKKKKIHFKIKKKVN